MGLTPNTEQGSKKRFKILFVDNSRTTRAVMGSLFEQQGYEAVCVGTGPEALEKLKQESFDIAVMDLYMPVMNGYEAAKIIRASNEPYKNIPIIALSASEDPKDVDLCKEVGMDEYIIKTEDNKKLFDVLKKYQSKS